VWAHKSALVSSKDFGEMNPTRWDFEYRSLLYKRKKDLDLVKRLIGLDLVPPTKDEMGNFEIDEKDKLGWLPLAFWLNPEVFGKIVEDIKQKSEEMAIGEQLEEESLLMAPTDIDVLGITDEEAQKMQEIARKRLEEDAKRLGIKTEEEMKDEEERPERIKPGVTIRNG